MSVNHRTQIHNTTTPNPPSPPPQPPQHSCDFHLGKYSLPVGWLSFAWLFGTAFLFFLPTEWPVTAEAMNYTCVIVGVVLLIGA